MSFPEKITMYSSIKNTTEPHYVTLDSALKRITEGKSHPIIGQLRYGDKSMKSKLPVAMFSGVFMGRKDDDLMEHSGLIVLDFDHIRVDEYKPLIGTDEYVRACWTSPSGDGLKVLVKVTNPERHRDHFRALKAYFEKTYALDVDPSGINESRLCFESHDPEMITNPDSRGFGHLLAETSAPEVPVQREIVTDYEKVDIIVHMIRKAQEGEKHTTLIRAAVLCGGYIAAGRMEEDEAIRILLRELERKGTVSDMDLAKRTIIDGIAQGRALPIREVMQDEQAARREMQVSDGDMSFISSDDSDFDWIEKFVKGDIPKGLTTGLPELDLYFVFKKEFTIINGHSNVGKTTMALFLMATSAVLHGWRWIIYSSENRPASIKMRLMEFLVDIPVSQMHYEERTAAYKWVNKHFTIINNTELYSYSDLLIFAEKLLRQEHYDGFLIDPYNSLKITMSKGKELSTHEYHYEAASEMLTFSMTKNIAVWVNAHAITEAVRRKGPDGLPVAPFAEDTEGGGKFVNRSDIFLTFHRKVQSPDRDIRARMEIHVRKMRNQETGGTNSPFDEPVLLEMNDTRTGFVTVLHRRKSFKPMYLNSGIIDVH